MCLRIFDFNIEFQKPIIVVILLRLYTATLGHPLPRLWLLCVHFLSRSRLWRLCGLVSGFCLIVIILPVENGWKGDRRWLISFGSVSFPLRLNSVSFFLRELDNRRPLRMSLDLVWTPKHWINILLPYIRWYTPSTLCSLPANHLSISYQASTFQLEPGRNSCWWFQVSLNIFRPTYSQHR